MTTTRLKYLSNEVIEDLRKNVSKNISRYRSGDFADLIPEANWSIELNVDVDLASLAGLDASGKPAAEISNSRIVWQALRTLSPALATEEGIWVRLTHIDCLSYARERWLDADGSDEAVEKAVREHFFAETVNRRRDDNAVSRLWWNAFVANLATPGGDLKALDVILSKADVRLNFVERSLTVSRPLLAAGIVRVMQREPWITDREDNFRALMRTLNRLGGGIVFEALSEDEVDSFMLECARRSGMPTHTASKGDAPSAAMPLAASGR